MSTVDAAVQRSVTRCSTEPPPRVVLDLSGVTFCDSQGLGTLVVLSRKASHAQSVLVLTNVGDFLHPRPRHHRPALRPDDPATSPVTPEPRPSGPARAARPPGRRGVRPRSRAQQRRSPRRPPRPSARQRASRSRTASAVRGELLALRPQVDEDRDLGPQHPRVERLGEVVDRAHRVPAQRELGVAVGGGQEDDRHVPGALAALDVLGRLEAVHVGHLRVEQDHREVVDEQLLERRLAAVDGRPSAPAGPAGSPPGPAGCPAGRRPAAPSPYPSRPPALRHADFPAACR